LSCYKYGVESYFAFPGIVVVVEIITTAVNGMSKIVVVVVEIITTAVNGMSKIVAVVLE
jgi:hypothetical protein